MEIPFLHFFKRKKTTDTASPEAVAAAPAIAPLEKPSSERMSKTVMPNATRTVQPRGSFHSPSMSPSMPSAGSHSGAAARTIAFGGSVGLATAPTTRELPAAVALALEPKVERVISLELTDLLAHLPAGFTKPAETLEGSRRILLKASEVEKGMANGKPTVSLSSIYQQMPEIFLRTVALSDTTQVQLPFGKVLDQFTNLHVRGDQERAQSVPQVQTPFLQVTLEDDTRFGTKTEIVLTEDLPPVRVEPATAKTISEAEPEPIASGTIPRPAAAVRVSVPPEKTSNGAAENKPAMIVDGPPPQPTRIPFKLTPNETDAPAPESVPASSGPSVSSGSLPTPTRIPFKVEAPSEAARPKPEPWLTAESFGLTGKGAPMGQSSAANGAMISLPLKGILESLPPFQLSGEIGEVMDDARIELPFAAISSQLASGRVSLTPKAFKEALPEAYRALFIAEDSAPNVSLPLQDVLKNLPAAAFEMRADQVEQEAGSNFATPFSAKADEDAKRFNGPAGPVTKPTAPAPEPISPAKTAAALMRSPLQTAFGTDAEVDAKTAVAHISKLPDVQGCALLFNDGLNLAGALPADAKAEGLCAMAPSLLERAKEHLGQTKLGALATLTLSCAKGSVTFCSHENLCLAVLHGESALDTAARQKLNLVVRELAKKYSHPG